MQKTSYFIKWKERRLVISALQLALTGALFLTSPVASAGTPDWLKQAAKAPLPAYPNDTDAVMLLSETFTTVSTTGDIRTTHRKAYKILRPEGRSFGTVSVYFDSETQLTFLKGWSITSQGEEYEVKESSAVETSAFSENLYADTRFKVLQIPASQPGSVVGYEYQQRQRPSVLQTVWSFQDQVPVRRARFVLELPSTWKYTAYWRNHAAASPQQAGENRWTWELADIEPIQEEPEMPSWRSVAGQLGISLSPRSAGGWESYQGSWAQIGRWYADLASGRLAITPTIRDKTRELISGTDDAMEKIRRLAFYVQRSIRYVAIEIGTGGFQPHAAQDVLASGYGDCKDKATLLNAMLHEAGIDSYFVLINSDRDYLSRDFPSLLSFNHVILAIHLPRQADNQGNRQGLLATLSEAKPGPLLIFDPTDSSTSLGYLPPILQSNDGLLVTDKGGEMVKLPLLPPTTNRLLRQATLTLDKSGNLQGTVGEIRSGFPAARLRERLLSLPKAQRQKVFQDLLTDLLDGAVLTHASLSGLEDFGGALAIEYGLMANAYAQHSGQLFLFRPCVLGRKSSDLLEGKARTQAVVFSDVTSESDVFDVSFPAEYTIDELPEPVRYEYRFATYKSELRAAEHALHYGRTYERKELRVPLEGVADLKTLYRRIADDERAYAILKSSKPISSSASRPSLPQAP